MIRAVIVAIILSFTSAGCNAHEVVTFNALSAREQAAVVETLRARHEHPFLVCVRAHESDEAGSYAAENPTSSASGAYQFLDSTWAVVSARAGHGGYPTAASAGWHIQDAVAFDTAIVRGERYHWSGTGC
jgi:hypothetical protein